MHKQRDDASAQLDSERADSALKKVQGSNAIPEAEVERLMH